MPTRHDNEKNICVVVATNNNSNNNNNHQTGHKQFNQKLESPCLNRNQQHRNIVVRATTKPYASAATTTSDNCITSSSPLASNGTQYNNKSSTASLAKPPSKPSSVSGLLDRQHQRLQSNNTQTRTVLVTNNNSNNNNNYNQNHNHNNNYSINNMTSQQSVVRMQQQQHSQQICLGPPTNTAARAGRRNDAAVSVVRPVMKLAGDFNFPDLSLPLSNSILKNNTTTVNISGNNNIKHASTNGGNTSVLIRDLSSQQEQITSPVLNYQQLQDQHQLHQLHQLLLMHQQQQQQQIKKSNEYDEMKLLKKYDDLFGETNDKAKQIDDSIVNGSTCNTLSSWLSSSKYNQYSSQQNLNDLVIGQQPQHQQQQIFAASIDEPYQQLMLQNSQLSTSASLSSLFLTGNGPPLSSDNSIDGANKSLHNRMLLRKEQELAKLIKRQHALLCQTLQYRRKQLHIIYAIWKSKDFKHAVEQAVLSYEDGLMAEGQQTTCSSSSACIIVDVLSVINLRPTLWTLDICQLLLPPIVNDLLQSKYDYYVQVASQSLQLIVKNFSSVIKTTIQASSTAAPSIGVDITREERYNRCLSCCNLLLNARSIVLKKQTCHGKLGKIYRDLAVYMIAALENWPLLVESSEQRKRATRNLTNNNSGALPQINEQQRKHQDHYLSKIDRLQSSCNSNNNEAGHGASGDDDDSKAETIENICVINQDKCSNEPRS